MGQSALKAATPLVRAMTEARIFATAHTRAAKIQREYCRQYVWEQDPVDI
jgi:hypothetical protein